MTAGDRDGLTQARLGLGRILRIKGQLELPLDPVHLWLVEMRTGLSNDRQRFCQQSEALRVVLSLAMGLSQEGKEIGAVLGARGSPHIDPLAYLCHPFLAAPALDQSPAPQDRPSREV